MLFVKNGQGYAAMTTFCRCINTPPPMMAQTIFHEFSNDLHNVYVQIAPPKNQWCSSCKNCCINLANLNANNNCSQNAKVSGDGVWQKRNYLSLNGVVTLISVSMENSLTLKFYQRSVNNVNSETIKRTLLNILTGKRSIFVLLIILTVQQLWKS